MDFVKEFFQFLVTRKKYWLIPLLICFLAIGGLLYIGSGTVASPFLYTLF